MADQKLIDRVLKLYALAAGTTFANEAATAHAMAEKLIAKYNLVLPSVKDRTAITTVNYKPHFTGAKWEWMLCVAVAKLCGCAAFFYGQDELTRFSLVGTVADLEACQYLLAILHEQRMRNWMQAKSSGASDAFYSFCYSFAQGVQARVDCQLTAQELQRSQAARSWLETKIGKIKTYDLGIHGRGRSEAGHAAGQAVSLHRGNLSGSNASSKRLGWNR